MLFSPLCTQHLHDRVGQVIQAQRRRADRVAHLEQPGENLLDVRMVTQRNRHEPGSRGVRSRLAREFEDAVGRERPDGKVVVTRPAETTEVRASAHHLHQEPRSELGVGREDAGRRRVSASVALSAALRTGTAAPLPATRNVRRQHAVVSVPRLVERRDVEAALLRKRAEQFVAAARFAERAARATGIEHFAFARGDHVGKQRQRLGVHERHGAADHDQRIVASCARPRSAEFPRGAAASGRSRSPTRTTPRTRRRRTRSPESATRASPAARLPPAARQVPASAAGTPARRRCRLGVEEAVDRLEAEVGHADPVGVGERQRNAQTTAVRLSNVAGFF